MKLPKNLIGVVKTIKDTTHRTIKTNDDCFKEISVNEKQYDEKGNLIMQFLLEDNKIEQKEFYEYDTFGNEISYSKYKYMTDFTFKDDDGLSCVEERKFKFNEKNDLIYEFESWSTNEHDGGKELYYDYEYNLQGKILQKITKTSDNSTVSIEEIEYYENGNLKRRKYSKTENFDDEIVYWEYKLDENGLVLEHTSYEDFKDGSPVIDEKTTTEVNKF